MYNVLFAQAESKNSTQAVDTVLRRESVRCCGLSLQIESSTSSCAPKYPNLGRGLCVVATINHGRISAALKSPNDGATGIAEGTRDSNLNPEDLSQRRLQISTLKDAATRLCDGSVVVAL